MLLTFMLFGRHKPNGTTDVSRGVRIKLRKITIGAIPYLLMYLKLHLFSCVQLYVLGSVGSVQCTM